MSGSSHVGEPHLERALRAARETKYLAVAPGVRHQAAGVLAEFFAGTRGVVVADGNTFDAGGRDVFESLRAADLHAEAAPFVFGPHVRAEYSCVDELLAALHAIDAVPVAVGSGTLNDLVKLVAHRLGRPYMVMATAASMDGYTAYGASITRQGSKQTFDCPAPLAVLADLDVIALAPAAMNASGYADLLAKNVAGADWIVAEAAGVEPIDPPVWETVQSRLRSWVAAPGGIVRGEPARLENLVHGLMMTGFAMQASRSSRAASGAEHQFSHLWDMQHHTHHGVAPSHGFKVGIGTLASLALYDELLRADVGALAVARAACGCPSAERVEARIAALFPPGELADKAREEMAAKAPDPRALAEQLARLRDGWPALRLRLADHLIRFDEAREMLGEAGCPTEPEQIGIGRARLRMSYEQAYHIRRRFTVLDVMEQLGLMPAALNRLFGPGGQWDLEAPGQSASGPGQEGK